MCGDATVSKLAVSAGKDVAVSQTKTRIINAPIATRRSKSKRVIVYTSIPTYGHRIDCYYDTTPAKGCNFSSLLEKVSIYLDIS
jgi:hypothetical protein